jgi:hypothetical protein
VGSTRRPPRSPSVRAAGASGSRDRPPHLADRDDDERRRQKTFAPDFKARTNAAGRSAFRTTIPA